MGIAAVVTRVMGLILTRILLLSFIAGILATIIIVVADIAVGITVVFGLHAAAIPSRSRVGICKQWGLSICALLGGCQPKI